MTASLWFQITSAFVSLVLVHAAAGEAPFVSVLADDGTDYRLHRTEAPITATAAAAKCAAAGGKLASLKSADQVRKTLWSQDVVDVTAQDTALLWTGLKLTWTGSSSRRRLLRGSDATQIIPRRLHDGVLASNSQGDIDIEDWSLIDILSQQIDASTDFLVPTHTTQDGRSRRLPELIRLWLFQQHQQTAAHHRSILSGDGLSPSLHNAKLTWADGSDASFILSQPSNLGFLACDRKKVAECCGAVFDIGPDPYISTDFPTIFFYPCGAERVSGVMMPQGFMCAVAPPVAELLNPQSLVSAKPLSPPPSPSIVFANKKCGSGSSPAAKTAKHPCTKCKPGTFSNDGLKCQKCPEGTSSRKGASSCE